MILEREIFKKIEYYIQKFPIVTLTGVRQCGKTTLLKEKFRDYKYVSLEDIDIREFAANDPRGFLETYNNKCIFDEVQRVPSLFSYIQTKVDNDKEMGQYILSGSHNFLLMEKISQSLAGRVAVLTLTPFSLKELYFNGTENIGIEDIILKGFYPAIYARDLLPKEYFNSYVQTYIEKDVRLVKNLTNTNEFIKLIKILATRSAQIINYTDIANAANISIPTLKEWISILIQSYIIFELPPYFNNISKRVIKSPKIYFYDTGLLCYLLNISTKEDLTENSLFGAIFENLIVSEYLKSRYEKAEIPEMYFYRDTNQNEIDLITKEENILSAYEIKASKTMNKNILDKLLKFSENIGITKNHSACIYTGKSIHSENGSFINYADAFC